MMALAHSGNFDLNHILLSYQKQELLFSKQIIE